MVPLKRGQLTENTIKVSSFVSNSGLILRHWPGNYNICPLRDISGNISARAHVACFVSLLQHSFPYPRPWAMAGGGVAPQDFWKTTNIERKNKY
jgi:hypothetical protein